MTKAIPDLVRPSGAAEVDTTYSATVDLEDNLVVMGIPVPDGTQVTVNKENVPTGNCRPIRSTRGQGGHIAQLQKAAQAVGQDLEAKIQKRQRGVNNDMAPPAKCVCGDPLQVMKVNRVDPPLRGAPLPRQINSAERNEETEKASPTLFVVQQQQRQPPPVIQQHQH
ncbi:hypothetical protein CVT25_013324 [Psilocybe cyanescens]|uniref:Uncharacterized protein n=1 Tax=Psilocybe cyanescens TaxID=93625 RepID=A0A409X0T3_PSICY|nr:hypothetical protein CVT25_013324 [Psilocybe cyanescens]